MIRCGQALGAENESAFLTTQDKSTADCSVGQTFLSVVVVEISPGRQECLPHRGEKCGRIMRDTFSAKSVKFPAMQVCPNSNAHRNFRTATTGRFPFMRYPRQQRIGKRTMLPLAPQGLTCGEKQPEFCGSLGVGRTIQDSGRHTPHMPCRTQGGTCTPGVRVPAIRSGVAVCVLLHSRRFFQTQSVRQGDRRSWS